MSLQHGDCLLLKQVIQEVKPETAISFITLEITCCHLFGILVIPQVNLDSVWGGDYTGGRNTEAILEDGRPNFVRTPFHFWVVYYCGSAKETEKQHRERRNTREVVR